MQRGCARCTKFDRRGAKPTPTCSTRRTPPSWTRLALIGRSSLRRRKEQMLFYSTLRSASCVKDQATEASVNPFDMGRLEGPTGGFDPFADLLPFTVKQRNLRVQRKGRFRMRSNRVNGQNEDETCVLGSHAAGAFEARLEQTHRIHASVRVAPVRRVENK